MAVTVDIRAEADQAITALQKVKGTIADVGDASETAQKKSSGGGWRQGVQDMRDFTVAAAGTIAIVKGAADAVGEFVDRGNQVTNATRAFNAYVDMIGEDVPGALNAMKDATAGMLSDFDLMQAGSRFAAMGLASTSDEMAQLTEIAVTLGGAMGKGPTDAIEEFSLMLANKSIPRLDTFGISASKVRDRMNELKDAGMDADTAFRMAVIEDAAPKLEALGGAADIAGGGMARLGARMQNAGDQIASGLSAMVDQAATTFDQLLQIGEMALDPTVNFGINFEADEAQANLEASIQDIDAGDIEIAAVMEWAADKDPEAVKIAISQLNSLPDVKKSAIIDWMADKDPAMVSAAIVALRDEDAVEVDAFIEWSEGQDPETVQSMIDAMATGNIDVKALISWTDGKDPETVRAGLDAIASGALSVDALIDWSDGKDPATLQEELNALSVGEVTVITAWSTTDNPTSVQSDIDSIEPPDDIEVAAALSPTAGPDIQDDLLGVDTLIVPIDGKLVPTAGTDIQGELNGIGTITVPVDGELAPTAAVELTNEFISIKPSVPVKPKPSETAAADLQAAFDELSSTLSIVPKMAAADLQATFDELSATLYVIPEMAQTIDDLINADRPRQIVIMFDEAPFAELEQRLTELEADEVVIESIVNVSRIDEIQQQLEEAGAINVEAVLDAQRAAAIRAELEEEIGKASVDQVFRDAGRAAVQELVESVSGETVEFGVALDSASLSDLINITTELDIPAAQVGVEVKKARAMGDLTGLKQLIEDFEGDDIPVALLVNADALDGLDIDPVELQTVYDDAGFEAIKAAAEDAGLDIVVGAIMGEDVSVQLARELLAMDLTPLEIAVALSGEDITGEIEGALRPVEFQAFADGDSLAEVRAAFVESGVDIPAGLDTDMIAAGLDEIGVSEIAIDAFIEEQSLAEMRQRLEDAGIANVVIDAVLSEGTTDNARELTDQLIEAANEAERLETASQGVSDALGATDVSGLKADIAEAFEFLDEQSMQQLELQFGITTDAQLAYDELITTVQEQAAAGGEIPIELPLALEAALATGEVSAEILSAVNEAAAEGNFQTAIDLLVNVAGVDVGDLPAPGEGSEVPMTGKVTAVDTSEAATEGAPEVPVKAQVAEIVMPDGDQALTISVTATISEIIMPETSPLGPEALGITETQAAVEAVIATMTEAEINYGAEATGVTETQTAAQDIVNLLTTIPPINLGLSDQLRVAEQINATLSTPIHKTVYIDEIPSGVEMF